MSAEMSEPSTIKSKLARVNGKGQLVCVLCQSQVSSEAVWTAHVNGRQHRDNAAKLRQKAAKRPQPLLAASTINHPPTKQPRHGPAETSRTSSLDEEPRREETRVCLAAQDQSRQERREAKARALEEEKKEAEEEKKLPEGFFDDASRDALAQGKETPKAAAEAEWERWEKELKAAEAESAAIAAAAEDASLAERELEQAEEQLERWERVQSLAKRKEDLIRNAIAKAAAEKEQREQLKLEAMQCEPDSGDEDEDPDLNHLLDWRSQKL